MFLIEKMLGETPQDVHAFLEGLIRHIYATPVAWLEYDLRDCYRFDGREFLRMHCAVGNFQARLSLRASSGKGFTRAFLHLGTRNGRVRAYLLVEGQISEHDPAEVQEIRQVAAVQGNHPSPGETSVKGPPLLS